MSKSVRLSRAQIQKLLGAQMPPEDRGAFGWIYAADTLIYAGWTVCVFASVAASMQGLFGHTDTAAIVHGFVTLVILSCLFAYITLRMRFRRAVDAGATGCTSMSWTGISSTTSPLARSSWAWCAKPCPTPSSTSTS